MVNAQRAYAIRCAIIFEVRIGRRPNLDDMYIYACTATGSRFSQRAAHQHMAIYRDALSPRYKLYRVLMILLKHSLRERDTALHKSRCTYAKGGKVCIDTDRV